MKNIKLSDIRFCDDRVQINYGYPVGHVDLQQELNELDLYRDFGTIEQVKNAIVHADYLESKAVALESELAELIEASNVLHNAWETQYKELVGYRESKDIVKTSNSQQSVPW